MAQGRASSTPSSWGSAFTIAPALLVATILISFWLSMVNSILPDPYLDEVFHVRQAQAYWQHNWRQWDPKITTPPGLYFLSYLVGAVLFLVSLRPAKPSVLQFRSFNGLLLFNSLPLSLRNLLVKIYTTETLLVSPDLDRTIAGVIFGSWEMNLTILNICLFPPIFFFSGLYYTDVASLLIVLETYSWDLSRSNKESSNELLQTRQTQGCPSWRTLIFWIYGLLSLTFRQTNIFWVAVFLGGLKVVRALYSKTANHTSPGSQRSLRDIVKHGELYDPPANNARFEGIV